VLIVVLKSWRVRKAMVSLALVRRKKAYLTIRRKAEWQGIGGRKERKSEDGEKNRQKLVGPHRAYALLR